MMILWVIVIALAIMSVMFFLGKGSFLISGYNTASEAQKAMYDEKKLCRVMGVGTSIITLCLLIGVLLEESGVYVIFPGVIIAVLIIFIGSRTYAKKSDYEWLDTKKKEPIKWYKNTKVFSVIFSGIVFIVVGVMLLSGDVKIEFNKTSLTANAFLSSSTTIEYSDIEKVELVEDIKLGSRTWGVGSFQINAGNFKNESFGKYKLYAYVKCHSYVVLNTKDGYVVLNEVSDDKTKELYQEIQQRVQ